MAVNLLDRAPGHAIKEPHHQENANHAENETLPAQFYVGM
jgi:hypothetical protein